MSYGNTCCRNYQHFYSIVLDICLDQTPAQAKKIRFCFGHNICKQAEELTQLICDVICRCLLYGCGMWCSRELYVHRDSQLVQVVGLYYGEVTMNCKFLHIPYRSRIEQLPDNVMWLKILKQKCPCGSHFVKIIWKLLSLKMSIYHIKS